MGAFEGWAVTPSTTQTNKKPLSPKGNRLLMSPLKKSRKNKKGDFPFYKKRPSGA
jgi:hypothetical protein